MRRVAGAIALTRPRNLRRQPRASAASRSRSRRRRRDAARARARSRARCACAVPDADGAELEAVIVNTAGGMAGGDRFDDRHRGRRRRAARASPPRRRRRSIARSAPTTTVDVTLDVGAGARARLAAAGDDPVRPRAAARARIEVDLAERCAPRCWPRRSCSAAPAWARRSTQGALLDRWRVRRDGRLIFAETVRLDGAIAAKLARAGGRRRRRRDRDRADRAGRRRDRRGGARARRQCRGEVGASAWNGIAVVRLVRRATARRCGTISLAVLAALRGGALPRLWLN